jgi:hypothetical protein
MSNHTVKIDYANGECEHVSYSSIFVGGLLMPTGDVETITDDLTGEIYYERIPV